MDKKLEIYTQKSHLYYGIQINDIIYTKMLKNLSLYSVSFTE